MERRGGRGIAITGTSTGAQRSAGGHHFLKLKKLGCSLDQRNLPNDCALLFTIQINASDEKLVTDKEDDRCLAMHHRSHSVVWVTKSLFRNLIRHAV